MLLSVPYIGNTFCPFLISLTKSLFHLHFQRTNLGCVNFLCFLLRVFALIFIISFHLACYFRDFLLLVCDVFIMMYIGVIFFVIFLGACWTWNHEFLFFMETEKNQPLFLSITEICFFLLSCLPLNSFYCLVFSVTCIFFSAVYNLLISCPMNFFRYYVF